MEKDILNKLGQNHTTACVFNNDLKFVGAIYSYKNEVFCLHMGSDFPFSDLTPKQQAIVKNEIVSGNYKLSKSHQC